MEPPPELSRAGAVVDQAIDTMMSEQIPSIAIAAALLGGALGLLARTLSPEQVVNVLQKAIDSTRAGTLDA